MEKKVDVDFLNDASSRGRKWVCWKKRAVMNHWMKRWHEHTGIEKNPKPACRHASAKSANLASGSLVKTD